MLNEQKSRFCIMRQQLFQLTLLQWLRQPVNDRDFSRTCGARGQGQRQAIKVQSRAAEEASYWFLTKTRDSVIRGVGGGRDESLCYHVLHQ